MQALNTSYHADVLASGSARQAATPLQPSQALKELSLPAATRSRPAEASADQPKARHQRRGRHKRWEAEGDEQSTGQPRDATQSPPASTPAQAESSFDAIAARIAGVVLICRLLPGSVALQLIATGCGWHFGRCSGHVNDGLHGKCMANICVAHAYNTQ